MSNVLKSNRVSICEEKKYVFNTKRIFSNHPSTASQGEKERKLESSFEEIKTKAEEEANKIVIRAGKQAEELIHNAQKKAQAILQTAHDQGYKKGYEEGYNQGYEKGLEEGRARGEEEYRASIERADAAKKEYKKMRDMLYQSCEQDMVRLAIDIARKIIGTRMEEDEKTYLQIAKKALSEVKGQKGIKLRCSSHDYPIAVANKDYLLSGLDGVDDIIIIEDMFLSRGSCIIDSDAGGIDGSVDTQIDKIKNAFKSMLLKSANGESNNDA